ncbi:MAG: cobalamin biosynthesis protein CobD [Deltaproteobacteria bacterium]|nr:cobalamin biosynthesis protein CobD [Deltaproteobacteria bacterium]
MSLAIPFLLGYLLDLLLGDPHHWPHPIRLMGRVCQFWEEMWYRNRVWAGCLYWLFVMGTVILPVTAVVAVLPFLPAPLGIVVAAYLVYACLATRSLHLESRGVMEALRQNDLEEARQRLSMLVSRETGRLNPQEVRRAVLETVAENLGDGVVAPIFYGLALGIPGMAGYKTASTMDSMAGYLNDRYRYFGWAAARADDLINYLPARLTAVLVAAVAPLGGLSPDGAWRAARRDAGKLKSPNAGWPMAAVAGALGVRLGGPAVYFGEIVEKPYMGEGDRDLEDADYERAVFLLYGVSLLMAASTAALLYLSGAGLWGLLAL